MMGDDYTLQNLAAVLEVPGSGDGPDADQLAAARRALELGLASRAGRLARPMLARSEE